MVFQAPVPTFQINADAPGSVFATRPARCSFCDGVWRDGRRPTSRTNFETTPSTQIFNCGCTTTKA